MSFLDRFMSCEDDEFVLKVDKDIRDFLDNSLTNRWIDCFESGVKVIIVKK
jgi:hypothetical protein